MCILCFILGWDLLYCTILGGLNLSSKECGVIKYLYIISIWRECEIE